MITKLNAAQERRLAEVYQEWLAVGHSTQPLDRKCAVKVVTALYARIGQPAPTVLFFSSPAVCVLAFGALRSQLGDQLGDQLRGQLGDQLRGQLRDQLRDQLWDQLWGQLGGQLGGQLWDQLRDQLWGQLWDQLWGQLWDQLGDQLRGQLGGQLRDQLGGQLWGQLGDQLGDQLGGQLWGQLGDQLWGQLGGQLRDQLGDQLGGQLWGQLRGQLGGQLWGQLGDQLGDQLGGQLWGQLGGQLWGQLGGQLRDQLWGQLGDRLWGQLGDRLRGQLWGSLGGQYWASCVAFYCFCKEVGVSYQAVHQELLDLWVLEARSMNFWFPYENVVLVSERPSSLVLDERGRLHAADTMACRYPDGWGVYAWHGVRIPARYYEHAPTPNSILEEENAEVRRALIERYGQDRFFLDAGASLLDTDSEHGAELVSIDLSNDPDGRMVALKLRCPSTAAVYVVRVPPEHTTARAALAWSYGMDKASDYVLAAEA